MFGAIAAFVVVGINTVFMLIVEQKMCEVIAISQKVISLKLGTLAFEGGPEEFIDSPEALKRVFL